MKKFKNKIEGIMTAGHHRNRSLIEQLLFGLSMGYGSAIRIRADLYRRNLLKSRKVPAFVLSIGNIVVGGTGKTPMTIYLARLIQRHGYRIAVLSRGYMGKAEKAGGIVSDGKKTIMEPESAGDEPFMMAKKLRDIPVIVGRNRYQSGMLAIQKFKSQVLVLDDAFQHIAIQRDMDIVLLDAENPYGNNHLLPRGILRAHISSLARADTIVLTRSNPSSTSNPLENSPLIKGKAVFKPHQRPYCQKYIKNTPPVESMFDLAFLKNQRVCAFSGLANNLNFRSTIENMGVETLRFFEFSDHHTYSRHDLNRIADFADNSRAAYILTTEKDFARIDPHFKWPTDLVVMGIELSFSGDLSFDNYIIDRIQKKGFIPEV